MMWFRRPEFDRYARFKSHGSAHEFFDYEEICEVELPLPSIGKQREIVKENNTIINRIKINEQLCQKLEETAQTLYKHWFVDFEFPDKNGKPYKYSGGEIEYCHELEQEIPQGWKLGKLRDIAAYSTDRISINNVQRNKYISTENMLQNRSGIVEITNLPEDSNVTKFKLDEILISNIRPYF
jgi:type I restriction enzyme, S subunit